MPKVKLDAMRDSNDLGIAPAIPPTFGKREEIMIPINMPPIKSKTFFI